MSAVVFWILLLGLGVLFMGWEFLLYLLLGTIAMFILSCYFTKWFT